MIIFLNLEKPFYLRGTNWTTGTWGGNFHDIQSLASFYSFWYEDSMQWRTQEKILGGQGRGSGFVGRPGAEPPDAGKFSKICKKIAEENSKNCCIFAYFAKKLPNHAVNFRAFGRKTQLLGEILRKFWKFANISRRKLQNCCIFAYFAKKLQNHALNFRSFGRKTHWLGKFSENFENFWWNINKNWIFIYFCENLLLKIETSEITSFFYNNFFRFWGVFEPPYPLRTPLTPCVYQIKYTVCFRILYKNLRTSKQVSKSSLGCQYRDVSSFPSFYFLILTPYGH